MNVGVRIKELMEERHMTQKDFSLITKITPAKLNLSLNGHRQLKFKEYEVICYCLGVGVDRFLEPCKPPKSWKGM